MTNTNKTGTLNINRLIEEAEALLLGEELTHCNNNCGHCDLPNCVDEKIQHAIHRPLVTTSSR